MGREKWIDNAKGIAIILVIIGHVSYGMEGAFNWDFVHGFHLIIFFLLSGYTLKSTSVTKTWIGKKFSRLLVPYFITCVAVMIMDIVNLWFLDHTNDIVSVTQSFNADLIRSFFASGWYHQFVGIELNSAIGAIWFFPALFFALLIVQLLLNRTSNSFYMGLLTGGCALIGIISSRFIWLPFSIQSGMMASFFVWLGYEIKQREVLRKLKWYHFATALIVFIMGIIMGLSAVWISTANMKDWILSSFVGIAGSLVVYWISIHIQKVNIFSFFGRISSYILCVHLFCINTLNRYCDAFLDYLGMTGNPRVWIRIILNIIFAVTVAAIIEIVKRKVTEKYTSAYVIRNEISKEETIYVCCGIVILLIVIGHFPISESLRRTIYSFHIAALIIVNGYFFASQKGNAKRMKGLFDNQVAPYILFIVAVLLKTLLLHGIWGSSLAETLMQECLTRCACGTRSSGSIPCPGRSARSARRACGSTAGRTAGC